MKINRTNYQEYFLDYFEHMLDPGQVAELMVFLEANPDLNAEFEEFEPVALSADSISFAGKNKLKKRDYNPVGPIHGINYEEWMVGRLEHDLTPSEEQELDRFLEANPDARLEFAQFLKSRLPVTAYTYENKEHLKKRAGVIFLGSPLGRILAVAASILLLISIFILNNRQAEPDAMVTTERPESLEPMNKRLPATFDYRIGDQVKPGSPGHIRSRNTKSFSEPGVTPLALLQPMQSIQVSNGTISAAAQPYTLLAAVDARNTYIAEPMFDNNTGEPKKSEKTFAARFVSGMFTNVFGKRERNPEKKTMLEYTIDGYNMIADRDVEVEKAYDAEGRIISYHVNGETIKIGRKANTALGE